MRFEISLTGQEAKQMLKVSVDHIISITEARSRVSELVQTTVDEDVWVLTKGGKPRVALVDVDYLNQLMRRAWFNDLAERSQFAFDSFLRRQGQEPDDLSDDSIEEILALAQS